MPLEDKTDFQIDVLQLDRECQRQSGLVKAYGDLLANAQLDLKTLKDRLEVRMAEVNLDARNHPESYNLTKVTEGVIDAAVTLDESVQALKRKVNEAQHAVHILQASAKSLDDKRPMLERLDSMDARGYFAEPHLSQRSRERQALNSEREANNHLTKKRKQPH